MNDLTTFNGGSNITMSSREIATLVEKRHDKVKQSIDRLAAKGVIIQPPMGDEQDTDAMGRLRTTSVYRLEKRDTFVVVAQLSPEFTARVVDRWQELEEQAFHGAIQPVIPADTLDQIERSFGISRMLSGKVTGIERQMTALTAAVATIAATVQPSGSGIYVEGHTSGQIWKAHNLPPLKGAAIWVGNRLAEMGCQINEHQTGSLGLSRARLFDRDKAEACMKNGLLHKAKVYASERMGQSKLKLIKGDDQ